MKESDRTVALVSLSNEISAPRIPVCVGSENWDLSANVVRWMQTAFPQDVRRHCRGCRFAMHSSDDDAASAAHDCGQRFCAARDRLSRIARGNKNWVVAPYCRGKYNEVSGIGVFRSMLVAKTQTEPLQSIGFHRTNLVRSTDYVPELDQERGDTTHATACYADKMNSVQLTGEECLQIKGQRTTVPCRGAGLRRRMRGDAAIFRDGPHESYISPWWWPHARRRPSAPSAKNSQPSAESALDPRSTPEFCARVPRPRPLIP